MTTPGLFITGSDTNVGKTFIAACLARAMVSRGKKVGVYKPAASGCRLVEGQFVSDDAEALCHAARREPEAERCCPQRFAAPLAPYLAARAQGETLDSRLLVKGLEYWRETSDILVVEGAGGLLSPLGEQELVADIALQISYPLVIVVANRIGAINQALLTLHAARTYRAGLAVAAIVLNDVSDLQSDDDPSRPLNQRELQSRCDVPVIACSWQDTRFGEDIDWLSLATNGV